MRIDGPAKPTIIGSGLLALDIVLSDLSGASAAYWAGGTCGNVLIALRFHDWESHPIARLRSGAAAERVLDDLRRWGVSDRFLSLTDDGSTPVIVERITLGGGGIPRHSFSWRCPDCGSQFPAFKPVLAAVAEEIATKIESPEVYFFDRPTPGAVLLARAFAKGGALVVFEPSGIGNPVLFRQAWEASHVVKYSHERLRELPETGVEGIPRLQIETLGEEGLRFRHVSQTGRAGRWAEMEAFPARSIRDTAGSGDWFTAGFIEKAGRAGARGFFELSDRDLREAFRYGQALSAWNCGFEGARGGMYAVERAAFVRHIQEILNGEDAEQHSYPMPLPKEVTNVGSICPACVIADASRPAQEASGSGR